MPLDPNIILSAAPPAKPIDFLALAKDRQAMQAGQQEQQLRGQEIQFNQAKLKEQQLNAQRQAALEQIGATIPIEDDGSVNADKLEAHYIAHGQPIAGATLAETLRKSNTTRVQLQKANVELQEATAKQAEAEAAHHGEIYDSLKDKSPEEQGPLLVAMLASAQKQEHVTPEVTAKLLQTLLPNGPDQPPDPAAVQNVMRQLSVDSPSAKAARTKNAEPYTLNRGDRRFVPGPDGKPAMVAEGAAIEPTPKAPPAVGTFEDYVTRTYGPNPTPQQILAARKAYQQADDKPSVTVTTQNADQTNVAETVKGMKDGSLPPILPGRATKEYLMLTAEAHRQGYDLARAATDWQATQKHIATMNGAQQLRLNQSINQLPELLDSVDALAAKWKGGRFPLLNSANLALAKGGAFGKDAASIANQLSAQIADVTADLGNVYMGGNSPTDEALGLAKKALSEKWDQKVLADMTALARKNVQTRKNSINNTGVAGASADNPYAPKPTAPAKADPLGIR